MTNRRESGTTSTRPARTCLCASLRSSALVSGSAARTIGAAAVWLLLWGCSQRQPDRTLLHTVPEEYEAPTPTLIWDETGRPQIREVLSWSPHFTTSGDVYYRARQGDSHFVASTGDFRRGPGFASVALIYVSPDGNPVGYITGGRRQSTLVEYEYFSWDRVVINNRIAPAFDEVGQLRFSPKEDHFAYWARTGKRRFIVTGKVATAEIQQLGPSFSSVSSPTFLSDGNELAYIASEGDGYFVVVGNRRGHRFEEVKSIVASLDASRFAFVARDDDQNWLVVVDDVAGPTFWDAHSPVFNPDGSKLAYAAMERGKWFVVVDSVHGPEFDEIGNIVFDATGEAVVYSARRGEQWCLVVGNEPGPFHESIQRLAFNGRGSGIAYVVREGAREFVVTDGSPGPKFDRVAWLTYKGGIVAYSGSKDAEKMVVVGARSWVEPGDVSTNFILSGDRTKISYGTMKGREFWWNTISLR